MYMKTFMCWHYILFCIDVSMKMAIYRWNIEESVFMDNF